jgi:hypothetical protein
MAEPPTPKACFSVAQNDTGDWIARERRSAIVRVFSTQKAAVHFALFEFSNRSAAALLTPRCQTPRAVRALSPLAQGVSRERSSGSSDAGDAGRVCARRRPAFP